VKDEHNQEVPIQQYLQNAFLKTWEMIVQVVGNLEGVLGFQVCHILFLSLNLSKPIQMINEPHPGYINLSSLHSFNYNTDLHLSHIRMSPCTITAASIASYM